MTVNNRAYINSSEEYTGKWKPLVDLTEKLHAKLKANFYKDTELTDKEKQCEAEPQNGLSRQFALYRTRNYYLAFTGICWCPVIIDTEYRGSPSKKIHCDSGGSSCGKYGTVLLFSACNKLGWALVWKVSINAVTEKIETDLLNTVKFGCQFAAKCSWYQESDSSKGRGITSVLKIFGSLSLLIFNVL